MAQDINTYTSNTSGGSETPKKVTGTDVSGKRALDVNVVQTVGGGGGGGTEYTEGDTDSSLTGTVALAEGPGNTATPLQVDALGNLKIAGTIALSSNDVTEDAVATANPTGPQLIARRRDTPASEVSLDGDHVALNSTSKGELYVKHLDTVPTTGALFSSRIDDVSGTTLYVGDANPGTATSAASWRIKRIVFTGDDAEILWADGDTNFNNIWDNRLSLTYT